MKMHLNISGGGGRGGGVDSSERCFCIKWQVDVEVVETEVFVLCLFFLLFFFRRLSPRGECDSRDGAKTDEAAVAIGTCDV